MNFKKPLLILLLVYTSLGAAAQVFNTYNGILTDNQRNRDVPFKIYYPQPLIGSYPVIIFSHGLGGSCNGYSYFGEFMAAHGYICIHIQHKGSDAEIWKDAQDNKAIIRAMKRAVARPKTSVDRFKDIPYLVDELEKMNRTSELLKGHIDTNRIAIAGHSYGAQTVLFIAGQKTAFGGFSFKDPRIKAGVALSPNAPEGVQAGETRIYNDIRIPLLHITGTNDGNPLADDNSEFTPATRTIPYQNIKNAPQYLIVLDQATHMTFSGRDLEQSQDPLNDTHLQNVLNASLAFFDCYLKGRKERGEWLKNDFKKTLSPKDRFEYK